MRDASLRAFADAERLLLADAADRPADGPSLGLDPIHLVRWRGHAFACLGRPEAVSVLTGALDAHDADLSRVESGLRMDLAIAHLAAGEREAARTQGSATTAIADAVGSARQRRRLQLFMAGVA